MNNVLGSHRQASSSVVSNYIKYKYTSSRTIYTSNDISNDMLHKYEVSVNYMKTWRSREQTLKLIRGDLTTSFQLLPSYFFMLQEMNIGTVTLIETDHLDRFKYCFMALGASIARWKYCRSVIVVDGTYLNGHYGGTLFTACTQDANNNIFILAFGIGDNENDKSWRWFLEMLKRAYGSRDEFSHYAKSGHNVIHAFNSAVRVYTVDEFEYQMQQLDSVNEDIRGYLLDVGYEKWSRLHMPTNRYSTLTSNIVESINAVTKAAKNYPIEALLESLRQTVQSWFCKNRDGVHGTFTKFATKYEKLLREMSNDVRNLKNVSSGSTSLSTCTGSNSNIEAKQYVSNRVVFALNQKRSSDGLLRRERSQHMKNHKL
ncbi:uncharacterized protein LOC111412654 [Olea europaea var. sylvestris]|uniref:uncharacterized protein LOC111412654 n=1 Tax=Olea europaea var. sylvestris TaxID=158386 RepID=UPI000C1D3CC0|nr:uncharacterized protein LOC111412654 [Olea europaea var. sylvestris]